MTPKRGGGRLEGLRVLVMGATSGIGVASARACAEEGARLVLSGRDPGKLAAIESELEGSVDATWQIDVTNLDAVCADLQELPDCDVLVNSAGLARHRPFLDATQEEFDATFQVNIRAAYFLYQAFARRRVAINLAGTIISISSQMGLVGGRDRTAYCASKHALEGLTKSMSLDLAQYGIRAVTVCPTFSETALALASLQDPTTKDWIMSSIPAGRLVTPDEIGVSVAFLASPAASMIVGTSLSIDGGWTAQ